MADARTPLPESKAFGDDERSVLLGYLAYHRAVLARKLDGLTDEQARLAAVPTSRITLLGLIRHMTDVERWWFRRVLVADDVAPSSPTTRSGTSPTMRPLPTRCRPTGTRSR